MAKSSHRISEDDVLRRMLKTPPKPHALLKKRKAKTTPVRESSAIDWRANKEKRGPSA
jgi:hypothetical protein